MKPLRIIGLSIICFMPFISTQLWAEDLADNFVILMHYEKQYEEMVNQCKANAKTVPETIVEAEPNRFYGVKPGSKCWPQVIEAFNQYYAHVCSHPSKEQFLGALARTYRARLSESQLQQAIKFYSSEIGGELISAHRIASADLLKMVADAQTESLPEAMTELDSRLQLLGEAEHQR